MAEPKNEILKRFRKAKERKSNWDKRYEEALDFAAPERQTYNQVVEGTKKSDKVFDGIAGNALDAFVSNLQSSLFPPAKAWLNLRAGFGIQKDGRDKANKELADVAEVAFNAIRNSNFDTQISSSFYDYALGVGALMVIKGTPEQPLHFVSTHVARLYIEEGAFGRPEGIFRENEVPFMAITQEWPDANIPKEVAEQYKEDTTKKLKVIEALIPKRIQEPKPGETALQEVDGYCYYVYTEQGEHELVKREQKSSPWIVFRWPGLPEQLYPEGPLLKALPDIKVYNKVKELLLKKGSRDLLGMYTVTDEGVLNVDNFQFGSSMFLPVESQDSIKVLPAAGDMGQLSQFLFSDLESKINKAMFAEPLGRVDAPVKTATEIAYRQAELAKKIGSAFGRLQYELMQPLINRILFILEELGLIELDGYKVDGRVINIEYMSPLALAQDQEDFMGSVQYVQTVTANYGPQVAMVMAPPDRFGKFWGQKLHVPEYLLPTDADLEPIKQMLYQQGVQQGMAQAQGAPVEGVV